MDYLDLDPIPDIRKCAAEVRSFCVKDHRNWPQDQDCGPGFGEIDHQHTGYVIDLANQTDRATWNGVGDEQLFAVDHVTVAVEYCLGA